MSKWVPVLGFPFWLVLAGGLAFVALRWGVDLLPTTAKLEGTDKAEELGRNRTAILALLGGLLAVVGAVYTGRNYQLARRSQMTERFFRAVGHLSAEQSPLRLGAIYELESIAKESSRDTDAVLNVLREFVEQQVGPTAEPVQGAALKVIERLDPPRVELTEWIRRIYRRVSERTSVASVRFGEAVPLALSMGRPLDRVLRGVGKAVTETNKVIWAALAVLSAPIAVLVSVVARTDLRRPQPLIVRQQRPTRELSEAIAQRQNAERAFALIQERIASAFEAGDDERVSLLQESSAEALTRLIRANHRVDHLIVQAAEGGDEHVRGSLDSRSGDSDDA